MGKHRPTEIQTIQTGHAELVMVCRSCGDSGFGDRGRGDLRHALKHALRASGQRRQVAVIAVDCLGVCPSHAVTIACASRPGQLTIVPQGQPADAVLASLGITLAVPQPEPA